MYIYTESDILIQKVIRRKRHVYIHI
jgi:hypothetical protein